MQSQKDAVVELVKIKLGATFTPYQDNALAALTPSQLNEIKEEVGQKILNSLVSYGKDNTKIGEVMAYARSMTMNHLKKARELNGGVAHQVVSSSGQNAGSNKVKNVNTETFKGIDLSLLPEDLKDYVRTL
jgi:pyruvate-formate lyase